MVMQNKLPDYEPDLLVGKTDLLLLFLIKESQYAYGYQLIKEIEKRSEGYFRFKEGTVYPALHRMENEGLIQGEWQGLPNAQERRYYRITDKGEQVLRGKMAAWQDLTAAVELVFKPTRSIVRG
jgi:DNA-binding PadR family transcriptional regulator